MQESAKTFYHVSDLVPSIIAELSGEKKALPEKGFLRYGLPSLDRFTGGLHTKDFVLLTGGGDFKRYALCEKIVRNLAMMRKKPVLVFPFNMPPYHFVKMLICQIADINWPLLSLEKIESHDIGNVVMSTWDKIKASSVYFPVKWTCNPQTVCEEIMSFSDLHPHIVVVCLGLPSPTASRKQPDWHAAFEGLKTRISKDYAIIVCVGKERTTNITQASNVIFQLVKDKRDSNNRCLELKISRNTHGPLGSARVMFNPVSGGIEEYGSYDKDLPRGNSYGDETGPHERQDEE